MVSELRYGQNEAGEPWQERLPDKQDLAILRETSPVRPDWGLKPGSCVMPFGAGFGRVPGGARRPQARTGTIDVQSDAITRRMPQGGPVRARMDAFEKVAWQALGSVGDGLLP